ncbi:hypothetical protein GLAREA_04100 [Glarea lozoyensis ATCC 20868]|uniref:Heterokaryon incompatibility domain-containing protein n=1 Tax=Glarea lozoyensis (strain ATCC 20868 / MF5171) TaxID=1116229 RepID=S3DXP6_GLAL2|nr:uncharacterized protein GLAREA_04100 [Glarea lozoyensis ATCC 20868]EPE31133.1 hypothetical protein GLAREA_04100 [Glarea lozoyensis ATCC 20868]
MADTIGAQIEPAVRFSYKPLESPDSIRLLLLEAPSDDHAEIITGHIQHTTLTQCERDLIEPYTALSYVWGDASITKAVLVDGAPVQVTVNLFNALRDIRDQKRVMRLWADALCINQSDNEEKALQVGLMGRIYSVAGSTIIYLGSPISNDNIDGVSKAIGHDSLDRSKCDDILRSSWFRRAWVFQEAVLSRDPRIQFGKWRCKWDDLVNFASQQQGIENTAQAGNRDIPLIADYVEVQAYQDITSAKAILNQMHKAKAALQTRHRFGYDATNSILRLTHARRGLGATDPRDLIFANIGVANDGKQIPLKVDYTSDCVQVYQDFARYQIMYGNGYEVFSCLSGRRCGKLAESLPSWVPDWTDSAGGQWEDLTRLCNAWLTLESPTGNNPSSNVFAEDGIELKTRYYGHPDRCRWLHNYSRPACRGKALDKVVRKSEPFHPIRDWIEIEHYPSIGLPSCSDNIACYQRLRKLHGDILPEIIISQDGRPSLPERDHSYNKVMAWSQTLGFIKLNITKGLSEEYVLLRLESGGLAWVLASAQPNEGDLIIEIETLGIKKGSVVDDELEYCGARTGFYLIRKCPTLLEDSTYHELHEELREQLEMKKEYWEGRTLIAICEKDYCSYSTDLLVPCQILMTAIPHFPDKLIISRSSLEQQYFLFL